MAMRFFLDNVRPRWRENRALAQHPLNHFHSQLDRWLEGFFDDLEDFPFGMMTRRDKNTEFTPDVDVKETDKAIEVHVELPGIDEKNISVSLKDKVLTIKGEKKHEEEVKKDQYHRMERSYGSFERSIGLPASVIADEVKAKFKNGVLNITLPKVIEQKDTAHQIEVKGA